MVPPQWWWSHQPLQASARNVSTRVRKSKCSSTFIRTPRTAEKLTFLAMFTFRCHFGPTESNRQVGPNHRLGQLWPQRAHSKRETKHSSKMLQNFKYLQASQCKPPENHCHVRSCKTLQSKGLLESSHVLLRK